MTAANSVFQQVFRGIGGGKRVAVMISAFFDESSEGDSNNGLLAVVGYALDSSGVDGFVPEWQEMLRRCRIPYFHMSECNACDGIFEDHTEAECDQCAREAIRIARKYPLHGHAFVLDQVEYRHALQDQGFDCAPYTFMVWSAFIHVNRWVHENRPDEKISLFFENGHKQEPRASELLQAAMSDDLHGRNRVASYAFFKKEDSEPGQAADLIAWQVRKGYENLRKNKPVRKDTQALIEDRRILTIEFTPELLGKIRSDFIKKSGSLDAASKILFSQTGLE